MSKKYIDYKTPSGSKAKFDKWSRREGIEPNVRWKIIKQDPGIISTLLALWPRPVQYRVLRYHKKYQYNLVAMKGKNNIFGVDGEKPRKIPPVTKAARVILGICSYVSKTDNLSAFL